MSNPHIGILHYTAPPVVGGVEAVMQAQADLFRRMDYPVTMVAGRGEASALPDGVSLVTIPEIDTQNETILEMNTFLETGDLPRGFDLFAEQLADRLTPVVAEFNHLIIHNVFTKHFNLALTVALEQLVKAGSIRHAIAWCHDFTWTSPHSRSKVHPGYPWDILRTYLPQMTYVTVSARRQSSLADLFGISHQKINLIYNGVEPVSLLGLSNEGMELARRLNLLEAGMIMLMPVRVTQAKNIEYAFRVVAALKQDRVAPKLVVSGPPDPHDPENMNYFRSLLELRQELGIENEASFVYESGPLPDEPYLIDERVVGDLYRMSDIVFMPSLREGFGMPVLEAGLAGVPVVSTDIPAAQEIGREDIIIISDHQPPGAVASIIVQLIRNNPLSRFRRNVRQNYTWEALFKRQIEPLLQDGRSQQ